MTSHIQFHLGDRLRKAREATGTDAKAFAALLGISRDSLRDYESGKTRPKAPVIRSWSQATGYSVSALLGHDGGDPDGGNVIDLNALREQANSAST